MKKKFKRKKKFKYKIILIPIFVIFILIVLNYISNIIRLSISNEAIINNIFKINNTYSYTEIKNNSLTKKIYLYFKKNILNSPVNILKNELNITKKEKEETEFVYKTTTSPLIYIYNSHQSEEYSREYLEEHNIIPNVLTASLILKDKLDQIGIFSIVEENDILDYMKKNNLNHAGSYKASRYFLTNAIKKYPEAELYIDLHRDAASHSTTITNINGKSCAKVLFVIGLENPNYEENLSIVTKINNIILEKFPTLTRGIMKKQGYGVNGIYNQDLSGNVILIEIGGHENNIEEINNTLDLIAIVIGEYLNEKKQTK